MLDGVRDAVRHWWLAVRCSVIGTYVGIIPGIGAQIVDWIAYGHAVQSAKDNARFGKGDIRGVIAPEAANNAIRGGALIPTIAFGIPGSLGASILLGALLIQGLQPGPDMLTRHLPITYSLVWTIVVANIVGAAMLMLWSGQIARLAFVRGHLLIPGVIMFVLMGAWTAGASIGDWITVIAFGVIGYVMKRGGWPRPPFVLALILGGLMEQTFHISMTAHRGASWLWERPLVIVIALLCLVTVILGARGITRLKRQDDGSRGVEGEGSERNPLVSLPLSAFWVLVFGYALIVSLDWPVGARRFPLAISVPGRPPRAPHTVDGSARLLRAARRDWRDCGALGGNPSQCPSREFHGLHRRTGPAAVPDIACRPEDCDPGLRRRLSPDLGRIWLVAFVGVWSGRLGRARPLL